MEIINQCTGTITSAYFSIYPYLYLLSCVFLCFSCPCFFWVSSLAYPNSLGTKGYVVVVGVVVVVVVIVVVVVVVVVIVVVVVVVVEIGSLPK